MEGEPSRLSGDPFTSLEEVNSGYDPSAASCCGGFELWRAEAVDQDAR